MCQSATVVALAKKNVDPSVYAIDAGSSLGALAGYVVNFAPRYAGMVSRAFEEISDSAAYCYPTAQTGTITLDAGGHCGM